jgi:hypothetical protein
MLGRIIQRNNSIIARNGDMEEHICVLLVRRNVMIHKLNIRNGYRSIFGNVDDTLWHKNIDSIGSLLHVDGNRDVIHQVARDARDLLISTQGSIPSISEVIDDNSHAVRPIVVGVRLVNDSLQGSGHGGSRDGELHELLVGRRLGREISSLRVAAWIRKQGSVNGGQCELQ